MQYFDKVICYFKNVVYICIKKQGQQQNLYTMTLYNIIATRNTYTERGIHSMVAHHSIKKTIASAVQFINLMVDTHSYDIPTKTWDKDGLVVYVANFTSPSGMKGWVEFEIWKEEIQ